jgi:hypothetical protein
MGQQEHAHDDLGFGGYRRGVEPSFYSPSNKAGRRNGASTPPWGDKGSSRELARAMGNDKAPGFFTEGFYRYSVVPASLDATNHHPNLLAQRFLFCLGDRLEPLACSPYRRCPVSPEGRFR